MPPKFSSRLERRGSDILKKFIFVLGLLLIVWTSISVAAEATKYQPNLFTDETSIEDDFKLLNIDINDYYKPEKYNYQKWYVIGMSEGYVDTDSFDIQTYFYLYNPTEYGSTDNYMSTPASFYLNYKIGEAGEEQSEQLAIKLDYNKEHLIYKIKGFTYSFTERAEIYITKIKHFSLNGSGITSDSSFKAVANHSKLNGFQVELSFNSTIIIESVEVVGMEIQPNNSFFNYVFSGEIFKDLFTDGVNSEKLKLYFYNFNFPNHIKPNSIEKAVFQYEKEFWKKKYRLKDFSAPELLSDDKISSEELTSELLPGEFTFDIGDKRDPITFPRFYLGNRINDQQFGDLEFKSIDIASFDYDCSIFLDYNCELEYDRFEINIFGKSPDTRYQEYSKLKDVELIELWYEKDSILYKCQVVSSPTDSKPMYPENPEPWYVVLWKFMVKIGEVILKCFGQTAPEPVCGGLGVALCVVGLIFSPGIIAFSIWLIISLLKLPFKIVERL